MIHQKENVQKSSPTGFARRQDILERLALKDTVFLQAHKRFPVQWPDAYLQLVGQPAEKDPVAKMGRPDQREFESDPNDLADAIGDHLKRPMPFLVRKHADRIIVLTTKRCHFYCRFCFRREVPPTSQTELSPGDWDAVFDYLRGEKDLREIILSGGDPLTLTNTKLFQIKKRIEALPHIDRWRIHTRAPVHFPQRVTLQLVKGLARGLPLRVVTHFNHCREVTPSVRAAINLFRRFQIPILNQSVLLAGVNDSALSQVQLWRAMVTLGIQPYYLHHPDRVPGNAHFRVSIRQGLELYRHIRDALGQRSPNYVLDLPDGRGKVPVEQLVAVHDNLYHFHHSNNQISQYPDIIS